MASALFTDPGIASAATVLSRAIAADDPYKDLSNLGSASANIELAIQRRQQTEGDRAASDFLADPTNAHYFDTPEGRIRFASRMVLTDPAKLKQLAEMNMALAVPTYGVEDPRSAAFSQAAGVDTRGTGYGATKHETADTARNATTAGAHVAAALGSARIAAAQREAQSLRDPRRPGDIIPPAERKRWGIPDVVTPGVPVLEGSTESVTPSVTGPQGPFAFANDANLPGGATRYDYSGNLLNPDGTVKEPVERRGPPTTVAQVIAQHIQDSGAVGRVAAGTATPGENALVTPTTAAATIRATSAVDAAKVRAAAVAAKGGNTIPGMRAKMIIDQLEQAQKDPNLTEEQRQQLAAAASAKLDEIDRDHGAAGGTVQAAAINVAGRKDVAELVTATRNRIADKSIANRLQIAEANIAQRGADTATRERIAQAKLDWLQERAEQTDANAVALVDQKHAAKMEEIAAAGAAKPNADKPLDKNQATLISNEVDRLVLSDLGHPVPSDPTMLPSRVAGKLSADQRNVGAAIKLRATELLSSKQAKSAVEAVAQAREELGYAAVDVPGSVYGTNKDLKLSRPRTTAPAPTPGGGAGYTLPNGTVIPEGHTLTQGGRTYVVQNGKPVLQQ